MTQTHAGVWTYQTQSWHTTSYRQRTLCLTVHFRAMPQTKSKSYRLNRHIRGRIKSATFRRVDRLVRLKACIMPHWSSNISISTPASTVSTSALQGSRPHSSVPNEKQQNTVLCLWCYKQNGTTTKWIHSNKRPGTLRSPGKLGR